MAQRAILQHKADFKEAITVLLEILSAMQHGVRFS
jgi:hypothetical protein